MSSRRPDSWRRWWTCRRWAWRPSGRAGSRSRRRGGRARRCPGSDRRDDRAGRQGPPAPRGPGQFRRGPRRPLQRAGPRPPHRDDATSGSSRTGRGSRRTGGRPIVTRTCRRPDLFHQRGYLARFIRTDPGGGVRGRRCPAARSCPGRGARMPSRSPWRRTGQGRSTRSCSRGSGGATTDHTIEPDPLVRDRTSRRPVGSSRARLPSPEPGEPSRGSPHHERAPKRRTPVRVAAFADGDGWCRGFEGWLPADPACGAENLRADPRATVKIDDKAFAVRAREVGAADRDRLWSLVTTAFKPYLHYERKARRPIPSSWTGRALVEAGP